MNDIRALSVPVYNLTLFGWSRGELTAEASTLEFEDKGLGRLWNDACDVGLDIVSHHTGKSERFVLQRQLTRRTADGLEVTGWELRPLKVDSRVRKVTIFND